MFLDIKKNIYMKNIAWYFRFCVLTLCCVMAGCSDDDDTPQKPTFPELQKINCEVGQTTEIEFEASTDWKLTSSSLWCQFIIDDEAMNSCSGTAGKQKVEIQINDNASELNKAYKAEISLWMNGFSNVIFEVTRPTEGYELVLKDQNGNVFTKENPLTISYDGQESYSVEANFDWRLTKWPEWMSASTSSGVAGDNSRKISPAIASGHTKNANTGTLTFVNEKGEELANIPVKYEGIPEDKIEFSTGTNPWKWSFSLSGTQYSSGGGTSGSTSWIDGPMPLGVVAKDDNYKIVLLKQDTNGYSRIISDGWYQVTDDHKGAIQIATDANVGDETRAGCLLVFPMAVYQIIGDNKFDEIVLPQGQIASDYERYGAIYFSQAASQGFNISDYDSGKLFKATKIADAASDNAYELVLDKKAYGSLTIVINGYSSSYVNLPASSVTKSDTWSGISVNGAMNSTFYIENIPDAVGSVRIEISDNGTIYGVLIVKIQDDLVSTTKMKLRK